MTKQEIKEAIFKRLREVEPRALPWAKRAIETNVTFKKNFGAISDETACAVFEALNEFEAVPQSGANGNV